MTTKIRRSTPKSVSAAKKAAALGSPKAQEPDRAGPPKVVMLPLVALKADPANARAHPDKHVRQIAASITAFGFNVPILVDHHNHVIAGHGRLLAAKLLGWTNVPTITLEHLNENQVRAYRIADNRLTDNSTWNERLLAEQLQILSSTDLDFELTAIGIELPEIDLRIQSLSEMDGEEEGMTELPGDDVPIVSKLGDLWQLGPHRILCGSALDPAAYAQLMQGAQAAMVFTDPPYNVPIAGHVGGKGAIKHGEFPMASGEMSSGDFVAFLTDSLSPTLGACRSGALMFVCMDWRHTSELMEAGLDLELELKNLCVWDKGTGGMGSLYRSQHELVFVFKGGIDSHINNIQLGRFGRNRTNVWSYPGVNSFARDTGEGNLLALHPTVKPVALVSDAILDVSSRRDVVLDPFLGSGTTVIAAERTGRVGYGIELDPRYVDTAIKRWQRLTGKRAVHGLTGDVFDDLLNDLGANPHQVEKSAPVKRSRRHG